MTDLTDPFDDHPDLSGDDPGPMVPLAAVMDALAAGRGLLDTYRRRGPSGLKLHGRTVVDIATEVGDEVLDEIRLVLCGETTP
jgi:hypothetical protein